VAEVVLAFKDGAEVNARVMIDTGASQGVILRYPFASSHGLLEKGGGTSTAPSLASGTLSLVALPVRELRIGSLRIAGPAVKAFRQPTGSGGYTETDGLLGNDVLRRYRVTFDYAHRRMLLEPL